MIVTNGTNNIINGCFPGTKQAQNAPARDYQQDFAIRCVAQIKEHRKGMSQPGDEIRFIVPSATQSGKTRAMILTCVEYRMELILESLKKGLKGEDFMIIVLSFSARDVNDQTIDDFAEPGLGIDVDAALRNAITTYASRGKTYNNYIHPGNIWSPSTSAILARAKSIRKNGGHIIWINDEADHSTGGEKDKNGVYHSKLREYVKQNDIPLFDIQPPAVRKSWEVGFHVTASLAHLLPLIQDESLVPSSRMRYFELDPGYSGLDTLNNHGFFRDNKPFIGRSNEPKLVQLLLGRMSEDFRKEDPLYHLVRAQGPLRNMLKSAWESAGGCAEEYDCSGKGRSINTLSQRLNQKPDVPTLILLKRGFSRGSRIFTVDHIGTMFDSIRNNDAAVIQSFAGRMTGRRSGPDTKIKPDPRPSRESSYRPRLEIYCDLEAVNKEIDVIEAQRADSGTYLEEFLRKEYGGMTGTHAKKSVVKNRSYRNPRVLVVSGTEQNHQNEVGKLGQLKNKHGTNVSMTTNTMSYNVKDLAGEYLTNPGRYHPAENGNGKAYIAFHADGRGRDSKCVNSWDNFPHKGKYIIVEMDVVLGPQGTVIVCNHGIEHP